MAKPYSTPLLIGIPAYNEEARIASVVREAARFGPVVVVDDGSTDLTAHTAYRAGASVIRFRQNAGKGAALAAIFEEALRIDPEVLVLLDGDGQHDPRQIPAVAAPCLEGWADVVVGSRYLSLRSDIPPHRSLGQRFFNHLTALASGVPCSDSQSGFRAFGRRAFERMALGERTFSVESEQQFECRRLRLDVAEVPIICSYEVPEKRSAWRQGLTVIDRLAVMTWKHRFQPIAGSAARSLETAIPKSRLATTVTSDRSHTA